LNAAGPFTHNSRIRVAVVSDLHAYETLKRGENRPSHLKIGSTEQQPENHPIWGLKQLIVNQDLHADMLLCPGDMGHQGSPAGIQFAWTALQDIKSALGAPSLVATAGNHDLDSRYLFGNPDPQQTLKNLNPLFPCTDEAIANHYWARDYALIMNPHVAVLTLNSSAHHGEEEHEKNHGRVTREALSLMRNRISEFSEIPVKILLCHHHPHQHSELNLGATDVMDRGQQLLDILGADEFGTWLVVHGHKHHPKISYAAGGNSSPVVFAAGSLCSDLFLELQTAARNQFHVITLDLDVVQRLGLVGRIRSWYWVYGTGWAPAKPSTGLPYECGFGYRGSISLLADRLAAITKGKLKKWAEIVSAVPETDFLIPQDARLLRQYLIRLHRIKVVDDDSGEPFEIGEIVGGIQH
jgi:hypothetical protein